ncbi:unnamed protein product [Lactuca virosa]|uniref:Uncharacterized protein n=1 Tax=Lactuca virosa TaxID=75947 RepID=A0AAU9MFQ5_9ASTR|nr:unnamed protein product [Lactuca virosa]
MSISSIFTKTYVLPQPPSSMNEDSKENIKAISPATRPPATQATQQPPSPAVLVGPRLGLPSSIVAPGPPVDTQQLPHNFKQISLQIQSLAAFNPTNRRHHKSLLQPPSPVDVFLAKTTKSLIVHYQSFN